MELTKQQHDLWSRIHRMDGMTRSGVGLIKIIAPDEYGKWNELNNKTEIERAALQEIKQGSPQTKSTTLTLAPMVTQGGNRCFFCRSK